MFNGFAIALASEGHLRYFKAQKASEGTTFHKPDSQYHTEKHQKPTNLTNMLDFFTSQYPQTEIALMPAYTHTHKHTYTHALPTEQRTNAHNTFSEPLTAIVAHQAVKDKQKGLSPLATDNAYIASHYLLC